MNQRFWEKVDIKKDNECWEWQAYAERYGRFFFKGKPVSSHRHCYTITHGNIPNDKCVLHKCDNTLCVNPKHLYLGDQKQNARDRKDRNRQGNIKGILHGRAKLNEEQVRQIKSTKKNVPHVNLAKKYGVTPEMISMIRRGINWQHIQ